MASVPRRKYVAPRRVARAAATRERIVSAARGLFSRNGYGATTLTAVAAEAEVAIQTVYATFGTKRAILSALIDSMEAEADMPKFLERVQATTDAVEQLALIVSLNRRLWERSVDVLEIARGASAVEPDLAGFFREGEGRRRSGQAPLVRGWARMGALKAGLDRATAGDILWTLTGPDVYRLLVVESGWSGRRYQSWLNASLGHALFGRDTGFT
jgi:AcrR family transcriptional regulator